MPKGSALILPTGVWLVPFFLFSVGYTIGSIIPTWLVLTKLKSTQEKRINTRSAKRTKSPIGSLLCILDKSSFIGSLNITELLQVSVCICSVMFELVWLITLILHTCKIWKLAAWVLYSSVAFRHGAILLSLLILIERLNVFDASVFRINTVTKQILYGFCVLYTILLSVWYVIYGYIINHMNRTNKLVRYQRRSTVGMLLGLCMASLSLCLAWIGHLFAHNLARMVANTIEQHSQTDDQEEDISGAPHIPHFVPDHTDTLPANDPKGASVGPSPISSDDSIDVNSSNVGENQKSVSSWMMNSIYLWNQNVNSNMSIRDLQIHQQKFVRVAARVVNLNVITIVSMLIGQLGLVFSALVSRQAWAPFIGAVLIHQSAVVVPFCVYLSFNFAKEHYDRWCGWTDRRWVKRVMGITSKVSRSISPVQQTNTV